MSVKGWNLLTAVGLALPALAVLAGCARFQPQPLSAVRNAADLEGRSFTNAQLRAFLETNLPAGLREWPVQEWNLELLTFAAFYYHPSLDVARAEWAVAQGGETTAGQRPNPTLNITPGYNTTTAIPSPWFPLGSLDLTIETAGKRRHRQARAAQLSEAARLNVATIAWQVHAGLRAGLLDFAAAGRRADRLEHQLRLQEQITQRLDQQAQAGAIANFETIPARTALSRAHLDLADARRQRAEARARIAEAIGVPLRALDGVQLAFEMDPPAPATTDLTLAELRRTALQSRTDILGSLAEYAAAEAALHLEIARQYPDIHLQPGYQFDQGDNKWSLGATVELPVLNQNQGPIAEARARRLEAAARFNALQAKVLAEIDRATAVLHATEANAATLAELAATQAERQRAVAAQFAAGAADQLDVLAAESEAATAALFQLEGQVKQQQALGALEDAVQRPLQLPAAIFHSTRADVL